MSDGKVHYNDDRQNELMKNKSANDNAAVSDEFTEKVQICEEVLSKDDSPIGNYSQTRITGHPQMTAEKQDTFVKLQIPEQNMKHVTTINVIKDDINDIDPPDKSSTTVKGCTKNKSEPYTYKINSGLKSAVELIPQDAIFSRSKYEKLNNTLNIDQTSLSRDGIINNVIPTCSVAPCRSTLPRNVEDDRIRSDYAADMLNHLQTSRSLSPHKTEVYNPKLLSGDEIPFNTYSASNEHKLKLNKREHDNSIPLQNYTIEKLPMNKKCVTIQSNRVQDVSRIGHSKPPNISKGTVIKIHREDNTPSNIKVIPVNLTGNAVRNMPYRGETKSTVDIPIHHCTDNTTTTYGKDHYLDIKQVDDNNMSSTHGHGINIAFNFKPFERFKLFPNDHTGRLIFSTPFSVQHADYIKKSEELKAPKHSRQIPINVINTPANITPTRNNSLFVNKPYDNFGSSFSTRFGSDIFFRRPWMQRSADIMEDMNQFMNSNIWLKDE